MTAFERFWRPRRFARTRHRLVALRRFSSLLTRAHAALTARSGGRIRRSFIFTGGMPVLVLTTVGRKSGKPRSTPLAYLRRGDGFAMMASNAGSDQVPAWWRNLQAHAGAEMLADRRRYLLSARQADPAEDEAIWATMARMNPGFDEYRRIGARKIPIVLLEPTPGARLSQSTSARQP